MKFLCNYCNQELIKHSIDFIEQLHTYECDCKRISKHNISNIFYTVKNNKITFYDIYHPIDGKIYNLEGSVNYTRIINTTNLLCLYKIPFYHLTSDNPTQEAIDLLTKFVNLKAFT